MNEAEDLNRVSEILSKIVTYQHDHSGDAVALSTLVAAGVLSPADQTFLESRHRLQTSFPGGLSRDGHVSYSDR